MASIGATLLERLSGGGTILRPQDRLALRSTLTRYVEGGLKPDSVRRALNRAGVSTAGLDLPGLARSVETEHRNKLTLQSARGNYVPREGRDMIAAPFKVPAQYRYTVETVYRDVDTGERFNAFRTVYSNDRLSKSAIGRLGVRAAEQGLFSPRGPSDPFAPVVVESSTLVNAYYNEDTDL